MNALRSCSINASGDTAALYRSYYENIHEHNGDYAQ
jgi:hypothetical protein